MWADRKNLLFGLTLMKIFTISQIPIFKLQIDQHLIDTV